MPMPRGEKQVHMGAFTDMYSKLAATAHPFPADLAAKSALFDEAAAKFTIVA
jgi:hypothetical protein